MSIFKRFHHDRRINQDYTVEIPCFGPHDTLGPQDYMIPQLFSDFENGFEQRCKTWLRNANPDMYNKGYMDMLINRYELETFEQLSIQRIKHKSVIHELSKIWAADKIKAEAKLKDAQDDRTSIENELQRLERIYNKGTSLEDTDNATTSPLSSTKEETINE